ncbi:unnamed protein product [Arabis nemorensis]|uniref:DUF577 domain-containing protein n=1 Tax=Arabis nemorensis TaxID=586526 RepID=A0A565AXF2_9BRAS|nr:unnamed protein product [Arabis nemorensis]
MEETEETHMKIFRKIVSFVAYNVVSLDNDGWDELSDCILSFVETEPLKAFHLFIELPRVYKRFIDRFKQRILVEGEKLLLLSHEEDVEVWSLCLVTLLKMGVQILDSVTRSSLVNITVSVLAKSVKELVNKGMVEFVVKGLENLERFFLRDRDLYGYSKNQCLYVSAFMHQIRELGSKIKEVSTRINWFIRANINEDLDRVYFEHVNTLSLVQIVGIVASVDQEERLKDMAIRRLNFLLSDDNPKKAETDVPLMRKLQTLLVSWLTKEGISGSMFKIIGEVVYHVADEMMSSGREPWLGLRDYIELKESKAVSAMFKRNFEEAQSKLLEVEAKSKAKLKD